MYDLKSKNLVMDIKRFQKLMEMNDIDLLMATSRENSGYLSGYFSHIWTWDVSYLQILNIEHEGTDYHVTTCVPKDLDRKEPFIVESYHKMEYVKNCDLWIKNIKPYSTNRDSPYTPPTELLKYSLYQENKDINDSPIEAIATGIREQGLEKGRIGIEGNKIGAIYLEQLKKLLPKAQFIGAKEIFVELRAIKTAEEILRLKEAYRVADKSYYAAFNTVEVGITPYEIFMKQMEVILKNKCSMTFQHCNFGGSNDFAVAAGADYKIKKGDHGVFDIGVYYKGYMTDFARIVSVGQPDDQIKKIHEVIIDTRREIIKNLKPGIKGCELFNKGTKYMESKGYFPAINCLGHGLGIGIHEHPFISSNEERKFSIGNTIVIEIYVEVKGIGSFLLEDAGLLTENGWVSFTTLSDELIIL